MKINIENYLGSKPFLYGRKLLKDLDIKSHYVDEYDAIGFFGYDVKKVTQEDRSSYALGDLFDDKTLTVKIPERNLILLADKMPPKRERITIFHEAGHEAIPWHRHLHISTKKRDVDPITQKNIEKEAFIAGGEVMFPLKHFLSDSLDLPLSFQSVNTLSEKYNGSFEATSIHYSLRNQNIMAIVVVIRNTPTEDQITHFNPHNYGQFVLQNMPAFKKVKPASTASLRVQYCSRSYRFPKFIKSGTEIEEGNIIYDCWKNEANTTGEIHASVFGSSTPFRYQAECIYYYDRVFVLLSLPDKEMPSFFPFTGVN